MSSFTVLEYGAESIAFLEKNSKKTIPAQRFALLSLYPSLCRSCSLARSLALPICRSRYRSCLSLRPAALFLSATKLGGGVPLGRAAVPARLLHGYRGFKAAAHRPADAPADGAHPNPVRHQMQTYLPGRDGVAFLGDGATSLHISHCCNRRQILLVHPPLFPPMDTPLPVPAQ